MFSYPFIPSLKQQPCKVVHQHKITAKHKTLAFQDADCQTGVFTNLAGRRYGGNGVLCHARCHPACCQHLKRSHWHQREGCGRFACSGCTQPLPAPFLPGLVPPQSGPSTHKSAQRHTLWALALLPPTQLPPSPPKKKLHPNSKIKSMTEFVFSFYLH